MHFSFRSSLCTAIIRCRPASLDYYLIAEAQGEAVTKSDDDQLLMHRLRAHVTSLAEEIGERNVLNSEALRRAAAYIEAEWDALGYALRKPCRHT